MASSQEVENTFKRVRQSIEEVGEGTVAAENEQQDTSKMIPRCVVARPTVVPDLTGKRMLKLMCKCSKVPLQQMFNTLTRLKQGWNVNGLKSVVEKHNKDFVGTIMKESPDILFLQETKLQAGMTDKYAKMIEHYSQAHFACSTGKKGYSGTAVFAKKDIRILSTAVGLGEFLSDDEGRTITLELEHFYFVGMYVANAGQGLVRLKYRIDTYDTAVRSYLESLSKKKPVILGGDLNVAHRDLDVYNFDAPHIKKQAGCTKEERESFTLLLNSQNRVDSFRALYPESRVFSFWSTRAGNRPLNRGLRLDYFVVPKDMIATSSAENVDGNQSKVRLFDSYILDDAAEKISDHAPICCQVIVPN